MKTAENNNKLVYAEKNENYSTLAFLGRNLGFDKRCLTSKSNSHRKAENAISCQNYERLG